MNYFPMALGVVSLLVAMWVPLTNGEYGAGPKKVLAWCAISIATLIIPTMLLTWGAMQLTARILAPNTTDISLFVTQIAWSVGVFSALYPLVWGVKFYPRLEGWISRLVPSSAGEEKTDHKPQGE